MRESETLLIVREIVIDVIGLLFAVLGIVGIVIAVIALVETLTNGTLT